MASRLPGAGESGGEGERERERKGNRQSQFLVPPEGVVHRPLLLPASWLPLPIVRLQSCSISYCLEGQRKRKGSWPTVSTWFSLVGSACGGYLGPSNTWWPKYQGPDNSLLHLEKSSGDLMAGADQGGTSGSWQQPWAPPTGSCLPHSPRVREWGGCGVKRRGLKQTSASKYAPELPQFCRTEVRLGTRSLPSSPGSLLLSLPPSSAS